MNITVTGGHLRTDLDRRERVINYLAAHPPEDGAERTTIHHVARELDVPPPTMYKIMREMQAEGVIAITGAVWEDGSHYQRKQSFVWTLTDDGRKLAEAIRRIRMVRA